MLAALITWRWRYRAIEWYRKMAAWQVIDGELRENLSYWQKKEIIALNIGKFLILQKI